MTKRSRYVVDSCCLGPSANRHSRSALLFALPIPPKLLPGMPSESCTSSLLLLVRMRSLQEEFSKLANSSSSSAVK